MTSPFEALAQGYNFGATVKAGEQKSKLSALAGQAYNAAPDQRQGIIGQAMGIDAEQGMALDKGLGETTDRAHRSLANAAKMLLETPEQYRPAQYQQIRAGLAKLIPGLPEQYDPSVGEAAKGLVAAYGGAGVGGNVQSTYIDAQGQRVAIMRDGSTQVLGANAPNNQIIDTGDGFVGVNKGNLSATPVIVGGQPQQGAPAPQPATAGPSGGASRVLNDATSASMPPDAVQGAITSLAGQYGGQVTSLRRSPEDNKRVGGVPNSQHLTGTAGDVVVPQAQKAAFIAAAEAQGLHVIDEGDHLHVQQRRGGGGQVAQAQPAPGQQLRSTPKPSAPPAGYRNNPDGTQSMIPGGPAQFAADARAAAAEAKKVAAEAKANAKAQAEASRQTEAATSANHLIAQIDGLTSHPGFADLGTAWGDAKINTPIVRNDAKDARAKLENIAGQVALATMARLKSLSATGATGFGSLTAPELKLLQNSIDTLQSENISNKQLTESLTNIRKFMDKTANWKGGQAPAAPEQAGGWSIQRVD